MSDDSQLHRSTLNSATHMSNDGNATGGNRDEATSASTMEKTLKQKYEGDALFKTTSSSHHPTIDSTYYAPPPNKREELSRLKTSMHLIPFDKEPVYNSQVDLSPSHLSSVKQPLTPPYRDYMFSTTTGTTHGSFSAKQKAEYAQPEIRKSPANTTMTYIAKYQVEESEKYYSGVYNSSKKSGDGDATWNRNAGSSSPSTTATIYVDPNRRYISETKDQFKHPLPNENVAHSWNDSVDRIRDRYVQMERTQRRPLVTQDPIHGEHLKPTSHVHHGLDNTFHRLDLQSTLKSKELNQYCYKDEQIRGRFGGPRPHIQPRSLKQTKLEPLRDDVKYQSFPPLFYGGMTTHTSSVHGPLSDTNPMANKTVPMYQSDASAMNPQPNYGNTVVNRGGGSSSSAAADDWWKDRDHEEDQPLEPSTTTMRDSYKPHSISDISNMSGKDYARAELRRPQILKKTRLDPGVPQMKPQYDNPGIGNQPMVDSRNLGMLSSQNTAALEREAQPARRFKDDQREFYDELLMSNTSFNRWK